MNKILFSALAVAVIWSFSSCKLYRRITGRKKVTADSVLVVRDSVRYAKDSAVERIDSLAANPAIPEAPSDAALIESLLPYWNAQPQWITFTGKANVHFEGKGENLDFGATIRMERGKAIWVSVRKLLFEVARVRITPDSVQIMDNFHSEVRSLPFSESSQLLPIQTDFASLQSIIVGDAVQTGHQPTTAQDTAAALILSFVTRGFSQSMQFDKPDTALHFQAVATEMASMVAENANWQTESGRRFAANRSIRMNDKGEFYSLNLEFSKVTFNESVEMPFSIPDSYERR